MADVTFIWDLVKEAMAIVGKSLEYKSTRKNLESAVRDLSPRLEKIEQAMRQMDLPTEHIEKLKEKLAENKEALGKHKIRWWSCVLAPYSQTKLDEGLTSLERLISVETQILMLQHLTDILSILSSQGHRPLGGPTNSAHDTYNAGTTQIFKDHLDDGHSQFTVGLNGDSMKGLKRKLLHGEEQVLNLYGLPGSGKTTKARKLCLDLQVKGKFKSNVIFETLGSQIQGNELICKLQDQLSKYGENAVLLVLDDVWPHSENMVDKLRLRSSESRILVTSRAQIRTVKARFPMDLLCKEDAEKLLRHFVRSSDIDFDEPERRKILLQIVDGCEGLPLAIEFIGGKLRGKDIEAFQKVQLEWSRGDSILDSHTELLGHLQNTLNLLVDESIMECFMDLGLFPEDHKVPITALIDMWIELYELNESRGIDAIIFIKELVAMNLAAGIKIRRIVGMDVDNYYNNDFLMQHDLYRELAIRISEQEPVEKRRRLIIDMSNDPPKGWPQQQQSLAASILSISTDKMVAPGWCNNIQAPDAVVLILNLNTAEYTLPEFIKEMGGLKVLIVTNCGFCTSDLRNLELLSSLLSLKRIRLQQVSIPSLCDLKNVQKLSLHMCQVKNAFENTSIDFSKAMPKLEDLSIEYCKDLVKLPTGLFNIVALKSLTVSNCHQFIGLPEDIEKLENLKTLRISYCANIEEMPESITKLKSLSLLDISFCVSLKKLSEEISKLQSLTKLYVTGCPVRALPDSVMGFEKLESVICDEYAFSFWEVIKLRFSGLNIKVATMDISLNWLS
ncbi:putative disease resistance protein At5g47280 [Neltuma alba]|uniref:putative disease resistance protein At5g47280 n=1 Tax=Neltuma alba TaxID=207710 RepID=UPI0010A3F11E|nr:putative disease resistance protein At5g47280 [Prosopis alba]